MSQAKDLAYELSVHFKFLYSKDDTAQQARWNELSLAKGIRDEAIRAYIFQDRLLDVCTWMLVTNNSEVSLLAKESSDHPGLKELASLVETDYHCGFDLVNAEPRDNDGYIKTLVTLRFDDGEIRIIFDSNEHVNSFIEKTRLKVDTSGVDKEIARLTRAIETLQYLKTFVLGT